MQARLNSQRFAYPTCVYNTGAQPVFASSASGPASYDNTPGAPFRAFFARSGAFQSTSIGRGPSTAHRLRLCFAQDDRGRTGIRDFTQLGSRSFPFWHWKLVNRQNLHDRTHLPVSKAKILLAMLSDFTFA